MLVTKMNPKILLGSGIIIAAYSTHLMSLFNLNADFNTIIWPRVVLGVGMGFLFIPLTTMTMANVKKEDMANASAIYNLLRNLGGQLWRCIYHNHDCKASAVSSGADSGTSYAI